MKEILCNLDLKIPKRIFGFFDKLGNKHVLRKVSHEAGE